MSISELLLNEHKPWLNIRVNNTTVDGVLSGGVMYPSTVISATGPTNLGINSSGGIFALPRATANIVITLPPPTIGGLTFKFILSATPDGTHTITITSSSTTGTLNGFWITGATAVNSFNGATNIILGATTANARIGDYCDVYSTGNQWYVRASSNGSASAWSSS